MRSPSPQPSPSQPGRSLLASLEAKRRNPPPSRRSNTPSTSVSQPRAASRLAWSPSALTARSPSLLAQRTSHLRSAPGFGHSRSRGRSPSHSTSKSKAQKRARSEDYGTLPSEREGAQHYRSTDLPVYGIGRSFETFGWVPPMSVGWRQTSGCATLLGCSMVHRGKNIVNGSKKSPFILVMCALCVLCPQCARAVHKRPPTMWS